MSRCPLHSPFILLNLLASSALGALMEDWQTVFPDTQRVWKLFGQDGPEWHLSSSDRNDSTQLNGTAHSLSAQVPGDILTDLMRAGMIDNPYMDRNFITQRSVWMGPPQYGNKSYDSDTIDSLQQRVRIWTYDCEIEIPYTSNTLVLVVEGIKMGATVKVNGVVLGEVTDQFLRHEFVLPKAALWSTTTRMRAQSDGATAVTPKRKLSGGRWWKQEPSFVCKVSIVLDPSIETNGRFQACSGGWDWAPYTQTGDQQGSRTFTFGIWKPLYIVEQNRVSITHVVPKIYYLGADVEDAPRSPMRQGAQYDFRADVHVHVNVLTSTSMDPLGSILLRGNFTNATSSAAMKNDGPQVITMSLLAPKDSIHLWWPSSAHHRHLQPLYSLQVSYQSLDGQFQTEWITRIIGFRTLDLVTINDTDPKLVQDSWHQEGSGDHGMFFRVNGAVISARGANVVPMDQLEGRLTDDAHRILVRSAAEAGMNMLRVWGGGMVLPQSFYHACDQFGILVYHDMMLVEENHHGAKDIPVLKEEIRHMVRSLSTHPSIALWSGCNECVVEMDTDMAIYATFVLETVAEEDCTRPLWPSSPSLTGWKTGVKRINGKPNGGPLATYSAMESKTSHSLEKHGPYRHGTSRTHPSVNANDDGGSHDTNTPPDLKVTSDVGPENPNTFVSEFGISTWSSFESISATLSLNEWSLHGSGAPDTCIHVRDTNYNKCSGENVLAQRNYACDSQVETYFGVTDYAAIGEDPFKAQLHKCIMASTLWLKGQIEIQRGSNSFGSLIWQLNENWPTGGWGLLEYGSAFGQKGQSVGGRWKPVMHLLKQSLYRDVFATCGQRRECYVRNDSNELLFSLSVVLETYNLTSGDLVNMSFIEISLLPGDGHVEHFQIPGSILPAEEVLVVSIKNASDAYIMRDHVLLWTEPLNLVKGASKVVIDVVSVEVQEDGTVSVTLVSDLLALHVVLTSPLEGCFIENSFVLRKEKPKKVYFVPALQRYSIDPEELRKTLRIEHLLSYV